MSKLIASVAGLVILAGCIAEMRPSIDPLNPMVVSFAPTPSGETLGGFREGDVVEFRAGNSQEMVVVSICTDGHPDNAFGRIYIQSLEHDFEVKTLRVHPTALKLVKQEVQGEVNEFSE